MAILITLEVANKFIGKTQKGIQMPLAAMQEFLHTPDPAAVCLTIGPLRFRQSADITTHCRRLCLCLTGLSLYLPHVIMLLTVGRLQCRLVDVYCQHTDMMLHDILPHVSSLLGEHAAFFYHVHVPSDMTVSHSDRIHLGLLRKLSLLQSALCCHSCMRLLYLL